MLGANLRYLVGNWAADRFGADFPYGTLIINVSGAFAIGILLSVLGERVEVSPVGRLLFATGFLGAYTTLSSYAWEAQVLVQVCVPLPAAGYVVGCDAREFVTVR